MRNLLAKTFFIALGLTSCGDHRVKDGVQTPPQAPGNPNPQPGQPNTPGGPTEPGSPTYPGSTPGSNNQLPQPQGSGAPGAPGTQPTQPTIPETGSNMPTISDGGLGPSEASDAQL